MHNSTFFNQFTHQSKKGIIVIYGNLLYKTLKVSWLLLLLFLKEFSNFSSEGLTYVYLGFFSVLLVLLLRAFLLYKNFQFKIENHHFIVQQGVLKKTNTSISFDRIQNINFKQNIIQQLINVYQVNIETAGSNKTEISIKALSLAAAEALKKEISFSKVSVTESNEEPTNQPFLKISFLELLKVGLTENHLQSLLLFLAILLGFYQQIEEILEMLNGTNLVSDIVLKSETILHESVLFFSLLLFVLISIAILSSLVKVVLKHFNLTLQLKENTFEIQQGLFTKKAIALRENKIQSLTISSNPLKKILGIYSVTFKQAISGKVQQKKDKLIRVVGCKKVQIVKIKEKLFYAKDIETSKKYFSDYYYKYRMYAVCFLVLLLLNSVGYFSFKTFQFLYSNLLLLPIFVVSIHFIYQKRYYKFSEDLLLVGNGFIETHTSYLPFYKVQNIKMKQTFFQYRRNLVDLVFQTAAGKIILPCIAKEKAVEIYNHTLTKIETSTKTWM